jgi:hypothetical protein
MTSLDQLQEREEGEKSTLHNSLPFPTAQLAQALRPYRAGVQSSARQLVGHKLEEQTNALDNLCDSLDLVVSRDRFELHAGRFYSSAARDSAGGVAH